MKGLFIMETKVVDLVYPKEVKEEIESLVDIYAPPMSALEVKENPSVLKDVDVIFSSWGGPTLDETFLEAAPNLKAMFYGAGTIKKIMTDAAWDRGIVITTASDANAVPVAEYTLSQILFLLKGGWQISHEVKQNKAYPNKRLMDISGGFGSTVGIISLSTVGRKVIELLQHFDLKVLLYDPFVSEEEAAKYHAQLCSLEEIFAKSDVVSLHSPLLEETTGMIKGEHFEKMKPNASFLNTARGAIVNEPEMIEVLKERQDITAVLDVTYPEPPIEGSPLYELPNVILTPHIAGSLGKECGRMGTYMLDELKHYSNGEALQWQVSRQKFNVMA
ncbi:hydroxyacid dehydrogenase [Oceanobacillus arenosus]|uniref:hydroxyacid dehydrogenase n=1 Tax=Oceanobacillus arenosus TaxID=1229153 RepID=UPI0026D7D230